MPQATGCWPEALAAVQYAHDTAKNATMGFSPYFLVFKPHPGRPETLALPREREAEGEEEWTPTESRREAAAKRTLKELKRIADVFRSVKQRIRDAQRQRAAKAKVTMKRPFRCGEHVRLPLTSAQRRTPGTKSSLYRVERQVVIKRRANTYWARSLDL